MSQPPEPITRRDFLRLAALSALGLALPRTVLASRGDYESFDAPPRAFGRIISWQQAIRSAPDQGSRRSPTPPGTRSCRSTLSCPGLPRGPRTQRGI